MALESLKDDIEKKNILLVCMTGKASSRFLAFRFRNEFGVYINRLKRGMKLDACPTIKYALGDFTITRVLDKHMDIDSPYNTYKHAGLPPGPIRIASIQVVDAVLNCQHHDYLYFCAKSDFSGYHNFSRTLRQHNAYAREYHRELNRRHIWK